MRDDEPMGFGFGASRRRSGPKKPMSVLTMVIIANLMVFVAQFGFGMFWDTTRGIPGGSVSRETLMQGQVWRLVTYMFVHGSILHILFNLFGIFMVGRVVLQALGSRHFLWLYFLGGIGAALAQIGISEAPIVGASGSLFALMVMFGMILWDTPIMALIAFIPVRLRARILVGAVILMTIVFFVFDQIMGGGGDVPLVSNVAHLAHLGGALVGYYYAKYLKIGGRTPTLADLQQQRQRFEAEQQQTSPAGTKKRRWVSRFSKDRVIEATVTKVEKGGGDTTINAILDKISEKGMHSLNEEERAILDRASKEMAAKNK